MPSEHSPTRPGRQRRGPRSSRERVGWALVLVGAVLFVTANIGARVGITVLPVDAHHVLGQAGGVAFALLGATLIGRD